MSLKINLPGKEQTGLSLDEMIKLTESPAIPLDIVAKLTPEDKEKFWDMMVAKDLDKVYTAALTYCRKSDTETATRLGFKLANSDNPRWVWYVAKELKNKELAAKVGYKMLEIETVDALAIGSYTNDEKLYRAARAKLLEEEPETLYEAAVGLKEELGNNEEDVVELYDFYMMIINDRELLQDALEAYVKEDVESALETGYKNNDKELVTRAGLELLPNNPKLAYHAGVFSGDKDLAKKALSEFGKIHNIDQKAIDLLYEDE